MESSTINPYERFFKLSYSILAIGMRGIGAVDWINAGLQNMVDASQKTNFSDFAMATKRWEQWFPGREAMIMNLVGRFYAPNLSFKLRPPKKDLYASLLGKAPWGRRISKVEIVASPDEVGWEKGWFSVAHDLHHYRKLDDSRTDKSEVELMQKVATLIQTEFAARLNPVLERDLPNYANRNELFTILAEAVFCEVREFGSGYGPSFGKLFRVWNKGNMPIATNGGGHVAVLCAR